MTTHLLEQLIICLIIWYLVWLIFIILQAAFGNRKMWWLIRIIYFLIISIIFMIVNWEVIPKYSLLLLELIQIIFIFGLSTILRKKEYVTEIMYLFLSSLFQQLYFLFLIKNTQTQTLIMPNLSIFTVFSIFFISSHILMILVPQMKLKGRIVFILFSLVGAIIFGCIFAVLPIWASFFINSILHCIFYIFLSMRAESHNLRMIL